MNIGGLGFIKRVVPFLVTFALGLFIASFFVVLSAPKVEIRTNWKESKYSELRMEYRRLKRENCRLKQEKRRLKRRVLVMEVPPPPAIAPVAPIPPAAPEAPQQ